MMCDSDTCAPQPFWPLPPKKNKENRWTMPAKQITNSV